MSAPANNVYEFITAEPLPGLAPQVLHAAKRCLLDLVGVAAAGRVTDASRIAHQVATQQWPAGPAGLTCSNGATLWFDGRKASPAGAAFALAATIDSMDAHDGYKPAKGHAGVAVLPCLVAVTEAERARCTSADLLSALIVGYEIACRVATAQHATSPLYSASGSWNAVGAAAVAARILKLPTTQVREALGIAEYFGPRSPMMRVIDHTTMVKDSSSWGAMTGVNAAYLASAGFTGAPAELVEDPALASIWNDLGQRWLITEQYFKLWPICRWAQPSVTAALALRSQHVLDARRIKRVVIHTFHEARRLAGHTPTSTDEAQYAIAFPTACAFLRGRIGVDEVAGSGLTDSEVMALSQRIEFAELPEYNAAFPGRRLAHLVVELDDGSKLTSAVTEPPGDPEHPLSDEQIIAKFYRLATPQLGQERAEQIHAAIGPFDQPEVDVAKLRKLLSEPCSTAIAAPPAPHIAAEPTKRRATLTAT